MNWGLEDLVAGALLLSVAGFAVALVLRHAKSKKHRVALIALIAAAFLAV